MKSPRVIGSHALWANSAIVRNIFFAGILTGLALCGSYLFLGVISTNGSPPQAKPHSWIAGVMLLIVFPLAIMTNIRHQLQTERQAKLFGLAFAGGIGVVVLVWTLLFPPFKMRIVCIAVALACFGCARLAGSVASLVWMLVLSRLPARYIVDDALHCPECGYCLIGNTSGACTECGLPIERLAGSVK